MANDQHLGTGEYKPERYWEQRAKICRGGGLEAVCGFGCSARENFAMAEVQSAALDRALKAIDLGNKKVVEIGCGIGRWTPMFLRRGAHYVGMDISPTMVERARQRVPEGEFLRMEGERLPFEDGSIDFIFSITVLHHNRYDQQAALIKEMIRVCRVGGWIFLMEGIAERERATFFNMFPRTSDGWVAEVGKYGNARLHNIQHLRWWLLRDGVLKTLRIIGIKDEKAIFAKIKSGVLLGATARYDKYLVRFLPRRFSTTAAMLFRKESG